MSNNRDGNNNNVKVVATEYGPEEGMMQWQIRIPPELKRSLDDEAERLTEHYGVPVSTSGLARKLLTEGLERSRAARAKGAR